MPSNLLFFVKAELQDVFGLPAGLIYFLKGTVLLQLKHADAIVQLHNIIINYLSVFLDGVKRDRHSCGVIEQLPGTIKASSPGFHL